MNNYLKALCVVFVASCGQAGPEAGQNDQPVIPNNVVVMDAGNVVNVSNGSRIKIGFYTAPDGSRVLSGKIKDTQLGVLVHAQSVGTGPLLYAPDLSGPLYLQDCGGVPVISVNALPEGAYATAFQDPQNRVLKLGPPSDCGLPQRTFTDVTDQLVRVTEVFE